MFENITYFFSSQTAYFWLAIPCVMTMAPDPSALTYDAVTLTIGGLWVEVHMNYIYGHIAAWAPLENNQAPDKLGLLRAQQMFFVTAPLHTLAIFQGTQDLEDSVRGQGRVALASLRLHQCHHHRQIMGADDDGHAVVVDRRWISQNRHREQALRRDRALARRRHELRLPLADGRAVGGHVLPQERDQSEGQAVADGPVHRGSVWKGPSDHAVALLHVPLLGGHRRAARAARARAERGFGLKTGPSGRRADDRGDGLPQV